MDREDEPVVVYGIYPGVARKDGLTAVCHYDYEQFRQVLGGDPSAYLDFLIQQEEAANNSARPNRVVRVPFDPGDFGQWLTQNDAWKNNAEGHSAWALTVAQDPPRLRALRERIPFLTYVPSEEKTTVVTLFLTVLTVYEPHQDTGPVTRALPDGLLSELRDHVQQSLNEVPGFTPLSPVRCEGLTVIPGTRIVDPDRATEAGELLGAHVLHALREGGHPPKVAPVPRSMRLRLRPYPDDVEPTILFLPIVLLGAEGPVLYVQHKLATESGPVTDDLAQLLHRRLRLPDPPPGVHYEASFVPSDFAEEFLRSVDEHLDELYLMDEDDDLFDDEDLDDEDFDDEDNPDDGDDDPDPDGSLPRPPHRGSRSTPRAIRHIRRIK